LTERGAMNNAPREKVAIGRVLSVSGYALPE
jgi:hypothetical protein